MKLLKYNNFINESNLNLLLEANMAYDKKFIEVLNDIYQNSENKIAKEVLDLEGKDVDVDTNQIKLSKNSNLIKFVSDKKSKSCKVDVDNTYDKSHLSKSSEIIYGDKFIDIRELNGKYVQFESFVDYGRSYFNIVFNEYESIENKTERLFLSSELNTLSSIINSRFTNLYQLKFTKGGKDYFCIGCDMTIEKTKVSEQEVRVGSFVQSLLKKAGKEFQQTEIDDFVNKFNSTVKKKEEDILSQFEIVQGEDIRKYYLVDNYLNSNHTLGSSCMRYDRCQDYLNIYTDNPGQVGLIILKSKDKPDKIKGRAILWKEPNYKNLKQSIEDKTPFMDRIYVNDSKDEELFKDFAIAKGFIYKKNQNYSTEEFMYGGKPAEEDEDTAIIVEIFLNRTTFNKFPYVDTMKYYYHEDGFLSNIDDLGSHYTLDETNGTAEGFSCERCDGDEEIQCPECGGDGLVECSECGGDRTRVCNSCDGDGDLECSWCEGSGTGEDGENECSHCEGSSRESCPDCDGDGTIDCSICYGDGEVECADCDSRGTIDCPDCQ